MRCIETVVIVMILLVPSVVFYSPQAEVSRNEESDIAKGGRSGPQTFQDEMGGWWMQDEEEDFEGGVFDDIKNTAGHTHLVRKELPVNQWEWQGIITDSYPGPRYDHGMAYDKDNQKVVLFGGYYYDGSQVHYLSDTWLFDIETQQWSNGASGPGARFAHSMVFDETNHRIVLFGGWTRIGDDW